MNHPITIDELYRALSRRIVQNNTAGSRLSRPRPKPVDAAQRAQIAAIDARGAKYNIAFDDSETVL